ncbi:MAG: hypothetical protein GWN62_12150, partial [Aliifodinibius sp.]|nr:hypothetical protein [Fodinibius sp.]
PYKKRYRLHELLRQYAIQRLEADQLLFETFNNHKEYFAEFLVKTENDIIGLNQLKAYGQIQEEFDNIRMAWNWAIKQDDYKFVDKALESLYWFCVFRGRIPDGEELFQRAR